MRASVIPAMPAWELSYLLCTPMIPLSVTRLVPCLRYNSVTSYIQIHYGLSIFLARFFSLRVLFAVVLSSSQCYRRLGESKSVTGRDFKRDVLIKPGWLVNRQQKNPLLFRNNWLFHLTSNPHKHRVGIVQKAAHVVLLATNNEELKNLRSMAIASSSSSLGLWRDIRTKVLSCYCKWWRASSRQLQAFLPLRQLKMGKCYYVFL